MKLVSKPIHALLNRLSTKNPPLEFHLSWHVGQDDSQEHRKQPRGRCQKHDDTRDHESDGEHIF